MSLPEALTKLVKDCNLCKFIDKPFIKYDVYHKWLPYKVKVLLLVESPPPGRKANFFYNLKMPDRLRSNIVRILGLDIREKLVPQWLRNRGIFLTDAIKCRPLTRRELSYMVINCSRILQREILLLQPRYVIAMGKTAHKAIRAIRKSLIDYKIVSLPHPNYVVRFRNDMIMDIRRVLDQLIQQEGL